MQTLEQLLANTLSFDIFQRETQGGKVEKAVLEVMIESNKKSLEHNFDKTPNFRQSKKKNIRSCTIIWQIASKNVIWSIYEYKAD